MLNVKTPGIIKVLLYLNRKNMKKQFYVIMKPSKSTRATKNLNIIKKRLLRL